MNIRQTTPMDEIRKALDEHFNNQTKSIINSLCYIGEAAVNKARQRGSYTDRTGNLRSSVGYVVAVDGHIVKDGGFEQVGKGEYGKEHGEDYAKSLVVGFPKGAVLIVVAGMKYASCVANKGFDVLDSAELEAEKLLKYLEG